MSPTQHKREEIRFGKLKWLNIYNPNEADTKYLARKFKFHHLDLEDCLAVNQRPKIDEYPSYLFITLHVPVVHARTKRVREQEIHFFVLDGYFITIHEGNKTIKKIFAACQKKKSTKDEYMHAGSGYLLYKVVNDLFESAFPILDDVSSSLVGIERDVFENDLQRDKLKEILALKKDIINFRRIIIPQRAVIAQLEHKNTKYSPDNLEIYFDDIVDTIEKMWSMLENYKELAESLHETNETIISHNTNNIIKVLTVFSVIMLPLTVITGFYGMNLQGLPFAESTVPVGIVGLIMFGVVASMLIFFKIKKWI